MILDSVSLKKGSPKSLGLSSWWLGLFTQFSGLQDFAHTMLEDFACTPPLGGFCWHIVKDFIGTHWVTHWSQVAFLRLPLLLLHPRLLNVAGHLPQQKGESGLFIMIAFSYNNLQLQWVICLSKRVSSLFIFDSIASYFFIWYLLCINILSHLSQHCIEVIILKKWSTLHHGRPDTSWRNSSTGRTHTFTANLASGLFKIVCETILLLESPCLLVHSSV